MKLSVESLVLALQAVDQDIRRREDLLRTAALTDEQAEDESAYVRDLQKALSELSSAYEEARAGDPSLPDVDSLLDRPLRADLLAARASAGDLTTVAGP